MPLDDPTASTPARLAAALSEAGCPQEMVTAALAGRYDDFLTDSPTPQVDLVRDLRALAIPRPALIEAVMAGDFDATSAEADAWAASPEGRATLAQLSAGFGADGG